MSLPGDQKADDEPLRDVMGTSCLFSAIEIGLSYGDGRKGAWSFWVACVASVSTFLFQQVAINVGEATEEKRKGTAVPSFLNSITHALLCIPLTLLWLAAVIILLVNILSHRQSVKVVVWVDLAFAIINMCIVGVQGVLTIYYRKKFFDKLKHTQLQATASVVAKISTGYLANEPPPTRSYPRPIPLSPLTQPPPQTVYNPVNQVASSSPVMTHQTGNPVNQMIRNPVYQPPDLAMV